MIAAAITLDPLFPLPVIALLVALLLFVFVLKEYSQKKGFMPGLIFAGLALTGITGILLNPSYSRTSSSVIILLTEGFESSLVDSLVEKNGKSKILLSPDAEDYPNAERLASLNSLALSAPDIITGQGIPSFAVELMRGTPFIFYPAKNEAGIIEVQLPEKLFENRASLFEGIVHCPDETTLVLYGPSGVEDSVTIPIGRNHFKLEFLPKTTGRFTYKLIEKTKAVTKTHTVPVEVSKPNPLSVLMLLAYPTFESRALKNFLAKGHEVKVRYEISKNIYRYEFHHSTPSRFSQLNDKLLDQTDLIIMDNEAYKSLRGAEVKLLEKSIRSGLGLFVLLNESPEKLSYVDKLLNASFIDNSGDSTVLPLSLKTQIRLPVWNVTLRNTHEVQSIYENKNSIIAGYRLTGMGKIGFSLWRQTYPLLLSGDSISYSSLWTRVLEKTARTSVTGTEVSTEGKIPYRANEPISLRIKSPGIKPEVIFQNIDLPLREDAILDDVWYAKIWSDKIGWNPIRMRNDSSEFAFYVHAKNEWEALHQRNISKHTLSAAEERLAENGNIEINEKINPLWFFLMVITGMSLLWFWPKFSGE